MEYCVFPAEQPGSGPGGSRGRARVEDGAHERNRTFDLLLTKEVLYRLSYVSVEPVTCRNTGCGAMERETGIEPAPSAWKAEVLPLNYSREGNRSRPTAPGLASMFPVQPETGGGRWIRTTEGVSQQIYSLPPLAAWVSLRDLPPRPIQPRCTTGVKQPAILTIAARAVNVPRETFSGQTLKRKCRTSPSRTRYSLPSRRMRPASRAPASPR